MHISVSIRVGVAFCLTILCGQGTMSAENKALPSAADVPMIVVNEMPKWTDLFDWVAAIRRDGFVLLKAVKQNGFFIAVFRTRDGDLAFCTQALEGRPFTTSFTAKENADSENDVFYRDKDTGTRLQPLLRDYRIETKTGYAIVGASDGTVYGIKKDAPVTVYIEYKVSKEKAANAPLGQPVTSDFVVFNESVQLR
jgi:hypothetical protein